MKNVITETKSLNALKKTGTILLSSILTGSMVVSPIFAKASDENPTIKTETVYCVLNADGTVSEEIVSDQLHDEDGINNIKETLDLKDVENVKSDEEPTVNGNEYTWNVDGTDVYYKGTSTKQLPVTVSIKYTLDGKEISADKLEGKSGHLKMSITFTNTQSETKTIDGKTITIHPSYLAGGLLTLDESKCSNVKCSQGKMTSDGSNEMVMFATVPGLNDTINQLGLDKVSEELDLSDTIEVEADVKKYEPATIMMGMTGDFNLSTISGIDSISDLTSGLSSLFSASDQLLEGSKELYDGTTTLKTESEPLTGIYPEIHTLADSTVTLYTGTQALKQGISTYTTGVSTLNYGNQSLYGITTGISQVQTAVSYSGTGQTLVDGTETLEAGLKELNTSVQNINADSIDQLTQAITATKTQLTNLNTILTSSTEAMESLQSDLKTATSKMSELSTTIGNISTDIATLNQTITDDNTSIGNVNSQIGTINSQIETDKTTLNNDISSSLAALNSAKVALEAEGKDTTAIDNAINNLNGIDTSSIGSVDTVDDLKTLDPTALLTDFQKINATLTDKDLQAAMKDANDQLESLDDYLNNEKTGAFAIVDTLSTILQQTSTGLDNMGLSKDQIKALQTGVAQLYAGSQSLNTGAKKLSESLGTLYTESKNGIDQVNAGSQALVAYNESLNSGATALDDGAAQLYSNKDSFDSMADGLKELGEALVTLNDGAKELYEGNQEFTDEGMNQLKSKVDLTLDEANLLKDTLNAIIELNNSSKSFAGAPEDAEVVTSYILRTKDAD